jgi:hypothetical protein
MKFSELSGGRFLKATDLPTGHRRVIIESIERESIGWPTPEDKYIAFFKGLTKGLVLNRTNQDVLTDAFGDDTANSIGQTVDLVVREVEFKGQRVPAIRIGLPAAGTRSAELSDDELNHRVDETAATEQRQSGDDDIPF